MKYLFTILICFIISDVNGQAIIKKIVDYNTISKFYTIPKTEKYEFPLVIIPNHKKVSNKINRNLDMDFLDMDSSNIQKSIFENVWASKEDSMGRLHDISYKIKANNKNFISLAISAEGCGAYCENFTTYYCYDLTTGKRILLKDIFTTQGAIFILNSLNKKRKNNMISEIQGAKDSLKVNRIRNDKEANYYYQEMIDLYTRCINENVISDFEYLDFYFTASELIIIPRRCSAHYNRNVDELERTEYHFTFKSLSKYLSPYTLKLIKRSLH